MLTKTEQIFEANSPYNNPYQGTQPRWLFVCTAGLLRSPTGATLAAGYGINARSCGADTDLALIPLTANLIMWADKIVFVFEDCLDTAVRTFADRPPLLRKLRGATVLEIPDIYDYMNPQLVLEYETQLFQNPAIV